MKNIWTDRWDASAPIHTTIVNWAFVVTFISVIVVGVAIGPY